MRRYCVAFLLMLPLIASASALAREKTIGVFVALADNKSQGIVPVPAAIGDGDDPDHNLYWGASEGLKGHFAHSANWRLVSRSEIKPADKSDTAFSATLTTDVLSVRVYHHARKDATLTAFAYRGRAIKRCLQDFESAIQRGDYDLVFYVGHNGLMDFDLPEAKREDNAGSKGATRASQSPKCDCAVLCCKSESYFKARVESAGGHPVALTTQFMYPGSFLVDAITERWLQGAPPSALRESAGAAYARNQKISEKAARGVFAKLEESHSNGSEETPAPKR